MPKTYKTKDGIVLKNVPDNTPEEEIRVRIQSIRANRGMTEGSALDRASRGAHAEGRSGFQNFLAGMGKAVADTGRGVGQMLGVVSDDDVAASRERDRSLMETGAGKAGNLTGYVGMAAPTAFIPGANTYTGAALVGGAFGASQPTAEGESRLKNTAIGAGSGLIGQKIGNEIAGAVGRRVAANQASQAANQVSDDILRESVEAGYSVTPTQARGGLLPRIGQAISGKYKTQELARVRNQPVTNQLARRAVGLADDTPVTRDALHTIRRNAFTEGYEPVRSAGLVNVDDQFSKSLDDIVSQFRGAERSFPNAVADDLTKAVDNLRVQSFDSADGIDMIKVLRDQADTAYRGGNNQMGGVYKKAAQALEEQIERHLNKLGEGGEQMLDAFKSARQRIAKTFSLERAVNEAGDVDAINLANQLSRGKPLSGELKTIARAGEQFRPSMRVPEGGSVSPLTILDFVGPGSLATASAAAGAGPAALLPAAIPAARVGARYSVLSRPAQNAMANKQYGNMLTDLLSMRNIPQAIGRGVAASAIPALSSN